MEYELDFHNKVSHSDGSEVSRYDTDNHVILIITSHNNIRFVLFRKNNRYIEQHCDHCYKDDPHYWLSRDETINTTSLKTAFEELDKTFWDDTNVDPDILLIFKDKFLNPMKDFLDDKSVIEKEIIKELISNMFNE